MKMASNDATPSNDGAAGLVPEINNEAMALDPVAGAAIAAPLTGQQNIIDPWIMNNFVQAPGGEFTVSPRNSPGEVLLNLELGPEINPYLAHLARMYNGYAGGFEVQVVLAGNAFTAGKIIFAAIPPNFPIDNLSAAQITMCPHVIVDVRQLEPVNLPMPDVRNNFFHYNQGSDSRLRLIAMLYTPLRANNSGDDVFTVSCRVLTRPSPDFSFNFLVPPTVESKTKPFTLPILTISEMSNSRFPVPIDSLHTSPNGNFVVQCQNGRVTLDGELMGTTQLLPSQICAFRGVLTRQVSRAGDQIDTATPRSFGNHWHIQLDNLNGTPYDPAEDIPGPLGTPDFQGIVFGVASQRNSDGTTRAHEAKVDTRTGRFTPKLGSLVISTDSEDFQQNKPTRFTPVGVGVDSEEEFDQWSLPDYSGPITHNMNLAPAVAPNFPGEQLLFFRSQLPSSGGISKGILDCLVPQEWVQHFYQESAPAQTQVALVRYVNPDTGRVLFEAKLHKLGFMTIAKDGDSPITVPPNGYFRFESWVNPFYTLAPMGTGNGRRRIQ
uniref:Capsid protein n=1 Tax=Human calicivirus NLV/2004-00/SWE TaxID=227516 RepID=Q80FL1_NORV|nr:capsid protein [Human calicivirus NLV/2004-00/SWE]